MERLVQDSQVLDVIRKHKDENLTVRRVMELLGYSSTASVQSLLERFEREGLIKRTRRTVIEVMEVK